MQYYAKLRIIANPTLRSQS